jgi:hypothetical protein
MHSSSRKGTISIYIRICNGRRRGLLRSIPAVIPLSGIEVQLKLRVGWGKEAEAPTPWSRAEPARPKAGE